MPRGWVFLLVLLLAVPSRAHAGDASGQRAAATLAWAGLVPVAIGAAGLRYNARRALHEDRDLASPLLTASLVSLNLGYATSITGGFLAARADPDAPRWPMHLAGGLVAGSAFLAIAAPGMARGWTFPLFTVLALEGIALPNAVILSFVQLDFARRGARGRR